MLQVPFDPAASSVAQPSRLPARRDQPSESDDFGSLVDSNTNAAAAASSSQSYNRSQSSRDVSNSGQDDSNDPASQTSAQQPPQNEATSQPKPERPANSSQAATSNNRPPIKHRSGKDENSDHGADSKQKAGNADAANPNAVAAPVTPVVITAANPASAAGAGGDAVGALQQTAGKAGKDAAAKTAIDPATGQPIAAGNETADKTDAKKTASATTSDQANAAVASVATGLVAAQSAGADGKTGETKGVQGSTGKANAKTAAAKASDNQAAKPADAKDDAANADTAAAANNNGNSDGASKSDADGVKAETARAAIHAGHDQPSADGAAAKPETNFQSILDLQSVPQVQPPAANNFTVTNVGAANASQALSAPVPLNGLAVDIASKASAGNSSFTIRLDPAELGQIDVRLDVDKHGQVTSHLTVERPATLDMLRNDAPKLQQALEDAGLKTGSNGLQFSLRDQSSQGQSHNDSNGQTRHSQRLIVSDETSAVPAAGGSYARMRASTSGVDISI